MAPQPSHDGVRHRDVDTCDAPRRQKKAASRLQNLLAAFINRCSISELISLHHIPDEPDVAADSSSFDR